MSGFLYLLRQLTELTFTYNLGVLEILPFLYTQSFQMLVQALVTSRLGYCNLLLSGLPLGTIQPLQHI